MARRTTGQSIVEMAFVLPVLLVVLFGVMEFGYYIFAYSTVSQAARNGAEVAAQLPPYPGWLAYKTSPPSGGGYPGFRGDQCVNTIYSAIESDVTVFGNTVNKGASIEQFVEIRYPGGADTRNLNDRGPVEVTIRYPVRGITPLFDLLGMNDRITMTVTQRRSIENLGIDPNRPKGAACAKDLKDWTENFK